jgi:hypothetical protein
VRLTGSPADIGRQHGTLLAAGVRIVVNEYAKGNETWRGRGEQLMERVRRMKQSLPQWYLAELSACAAAASVDEDELLYAQCEGDVRSLPGCTVYVAFGPSTHDGAVEIGRNFDYWGLDSTKECVIVLAVVPRAEDGHAFVSVGWSGILGGWTFYNEKGLFVANNLGGFSRKNPLGVPTLILERIVAQTAANVDEAIRVIRESPRMRGQAMVIGFAGDPDAGIAPDAAVVEYDAERVEVTRQTRGFVFDTSIGTRPEMLLEILGRPQRTAIDAIKAAGVGITLHSVAIRPREGRIWVAHGRRSNAHLGEYVEYDIRALLGR